MTATNTDAAAIEAISPVDLSAYLRANGWRSGEELAGGLAKAWLKTIDGGEIDVIVPLDRSLRDFRRRIVETLGSLEQIEKRSVLQILADIQQVAADVIRWRWIQNNAEDGTMPLDQGQQLIAQVRGQLLAAACSTVERRQFFASRKPPKAMDYLHRARLGQSERGSYVVAVQCPISPVLPFDGLPDADPFERRVTLTLANALQSLITASSHAMSNDKLDRARLADDGISANLCESVSAMLGQENIRRSVEVRFSYAAARPASPTAIRIARFSSDLAPIISEIGNELRETATREDFELVGFVTDLSRGPDQDFGAAVIQGLVDDEFRRVELDAAAEDYEGVLTVAHGDRKTVRCEGELVKVKGRSFRLLNARGFRILRAE
jgi:hypothetical protein